MQSLRFLSFLHKTRDRRLLISLTWTIGCVSAVLMTLSLGNFFIYITPPPPKPENKTSLLFCKVYKVPNKRDWTKEKYEQLPIGAFSASKPGCDLSCFLRSQPCARSTHPHGARQHAVTALVTALVDRHVGVQRCHGRQLDGPVEQ